MAGKGVGSNDDLVPLVDTHGYLRDVHGLKAKMYET